MGKKEDRERFFYTVAASAVAIFTGGLGAGFSAALAGVTFTKVALATAASYALSALSPQPRQQGNASGGYPVNVNALSPNAPRQVIYGETRVGGVIFFQHVFLDSLQQCIAFADHEIDSFQDVYFNEERVTAKTQPYTNFFKVTQLTDTEGTARKVSKYYSYEQRLGTLDQEVVDTFSNQWNAEHRAVGVAYLSPFYNYSSSKFPNGVPVISALIRGKKVYDPRTGETAFTDSGDVEIGRNPALILRDYLLYSGIATEAELDDDAFSAAANICDEDVTLASGGTQKRYRCDGAFTTEENPQDIIKSITATMGGMVWYSNGKWSCKAAAYTTPVLTLDEDDLRSGLEISTRNSRRDGFNKVVGLFRGAETLWQPTNFPEVKSDVFVEVDGGEESTLELDLPFVSTSTQAQRIAKLALYRNREQLKISGSFGMRALQLSVGDIIKINNSRLGFVEKQFEVVEWTFGLNGEMALEVAMTLQEISAEVFEWDAEESTFESNNTTLSSPFDVPDVGLKMSKETRIINQKTVTALVIDVTSDNPERVENVEIFGRQEPLGYTVHDDLVFSDLTIAPSQWAMWDGELNTWNHQNMSEDVSIIALGVEPNFNRNNEQVYQDVEVGQYMKITFSDDGKRGNFIIFKITAINQEGGLLGNYPNYQFSVTYIDSFGDLTGLGVGEPTPQLFEFYSYQPEDTQNYELIGSGELGRFELIDINAPIIDEAYIVGYDIKARAVNALGVKGAFTEKVFKVNGDTTGPSAPTNLNYTVASGSLFFSWDAGTDADLSHYKLYYSTDTTATFGDGTSNVIVEKISRPATTASYPLASGTFFLRPYDKSGNAGATTAIVVASSELPTYSNSETDTESPTFAGSRTNLRVSSGELRISTSQPYASGEYLFDHDGNDYMETSTSAVETVRVSYEVDLYRTISASWDRVPNQIDTWPSNIEDVTDSDQDFGDISVQVLVATTPDDPSGTPTWSDYRPAIGTLQGRGFKFKAILSRTHRYVNVYVTTLKAKLEY